MPVPEAQTATEPNDRPTAERAAPRWLLGLALLLGLGAFRGLLTFEAPGEAAREIEGWFFTASDTAPAVVLALALWLLSRRWSRLRALPARSGPVWLTAPLLAVGLAMQAWATLTGGRDLLVISLLLVGSGLATLWKGRGALRVVWLPGLLLLFAIPIPSPLLSAIIYRFQLWTAQWAGWLLTRLGESAFVSGDLILRPEGTFAIIESCSGMRSVQTLTLLSILMVGMMHRRGLHAVVLLISAPLIAFAMNGLRVLTLIFNPHSEIVAIHNLQGVAVLLGGLVGLYGLDVLLEGVLSRGLHSAPPPEGVSGGGSSELRPSDPRRGSRWWYRGRALEPGWSRRGASWAVSVLAACLLISVLVPPWPPELRLGRGLSARFSDALEDWQWSRLEVDRAFLGGAWFREQVFGRYRRGEESVDLFVGIGDRGWRGGTFYSPKTALPGSGWIVIDRGVEATEMGGPAVEWQVLRKGSSRVLVNHWYLGTRGLGRESLRALLALDAGPSRLVQDGVVVRLTTPLGGPGLSGLDAARERLARVRSTLGPRFEALLSATPGNQFSLFSVSGKSCSHMLVLNHVLPSTESATYVRERHGTSLAT